MRLSGSENISCNKDAILPIEKFIPISKTPIQDAIRLLIKNELTEEEKGFGFSSEFPNPGFNLVGANLRDGLLTLEFTEVPDFTTGGSCRVSILTTQIQKTALQFPEVETVILKPDSLFQP